MAAFALSRRISGPLEMLPRAACVRERPRFLAREFGRSGATAMYHLRESGLPLWLRHNTPDVFALDQAFVQRHFELPAEAAARLPRDRDLQLVDLGANIGLFAIALLAVRPRLQVTSFEPDPATAAVLRRTIGANDPERWQLVEACAAAADGVVRFESGQFGLSRVSDDGAGDELAAVDVLPYLADADVIKIDIEGSEWDILLDERFANVAADVIHLEYHGRRCPDPDPRSLASGVLEGSGYVVRQLVETTPTEGILAAWRNGRA
jgi:FkbM family methyltransferase